MLSKPLKLSDEYKTSFKIDVENHLFENIKPLTLNKAKEINSKYIFNWKWRICQICSKNFDILKEGIYYTCEECL